MSDPGWTNNAPTAAPGWYPTGDGRQGYWDGTAWVTVDPAAAATGMAGPNDDTVMGMIAHLLSLQASFLGPLVLWFLKKDKSPYIGYHAREALNFQITMVIAFIASIIIALAVSPVVGLILIGVIYIANIGLTLRAAYVAKKGRAYRYPLTLRFVR